MQNGFTKTKYACYYTYLAMSSVFSLPPILFVTFREMYGISYSLLGSLVLINFCTQLAIDLIFSFFPEKFNIKLTVRIMPLLTSAGLFTYALTPYLFPFNVYAGLVAGTVLFSLAAGLCEVLLSPIVAALPSDNSERDMSTLHSLYAYGVLTVVLVSTLFFKVFGRENWMFLTMFWAVLPLISSVMYSVFPLPELNIGKNADGGNSVRKSSGFALCVLCIFFGSAAENAMTDWISTFAENALGISKSVGDILGLALFAMLLGLGRTWYAKFGKKIYPVLLGGMIASAVCYLIVGVVSVPLVSMIACTLTGLFTAMLWPGTLILMEEHFPSPGIAAYALMAAGGDLGASVSPQLLGVVIDKVSASNWAVSLSETTALSPEQIGMKIGMLVSIAFPVLGVIVLIIMKRTLKERKS